MSGCAAAAAPGDAGGLGAKGEATAGMAVCVGMHDYFGCMQDDIGRPRRFYSVKSALEGVDEEPPPSMTLVSVGTWSSRPASAILVLLSLDGGMMIAAPVQR